MFLEERDFVYYNYTRTLDPFRWIKLIHFEGQVKMSVIQLRSGDLHFIQSSSRTINLICRVQGKPPPNWQFSSTTRPMAFLLLQQTLLVNSPYS